LQVICKTRKNRLVKQECTQRFADKKQKTMISSQTMGYLHANSIFPKNGRRAATHFLFSVRHPLSRFLSWCKTLKNTQYYFVSWLHLLTTSLPWFFPLCRRVQSSPQLRSTRTQQSLLQNKRLEDGVFQ
jgi:hypothetical protein